MILGVADAACERLNLDQEGKNERRCLL